MMVKEIDVATKNLFEIRPDRQKTSYVSAADPPQESTAGTQQGARALVITYNSFPPPLLITELG